MLLSRAEGREGVGDIGGVGVVGHFDVLPYCVLLTQCYIQERQSDIAP